MKKNLLLLFNRVNYIELKHTIRIMKITAVFTLIAIFQLSAASLHSQNAKVSISRNNLPLKEFIHEIEKQTDYLFMYNEKEIDLQEQVHVKAKDKPVSQLLEEVFGNSQIKHNFNEGYISLRKVKNTALPETKQNSKTVSGLVKDANGEPIIGANIVEKGTTNGTITDIDGKYTLSVSEGATLMVSYIGYNPQEIKVGKESDIMIVMTEDTQALEEVVVVGFGTQKKANLTGAVSTVKMEEVLGDRPVASVNQALQGTMPGLQITSTSGKPGQSMNMNIRGINRINIDEYGEGQPLVLVDNVPMDINMISPSDIETVTVLKDAASAAIYGARAAFGVILITTKQSGKEQKARINYNNNFAFSTPQGLIQKASPMQTVQFYKDMNYKTGRYAMGGQNIDAWMGYLEDYAANPSKYPLGYHIDEAGQRYDLKEVNHLERMLSGSGFQQTHNASIDGGTAKTAYRLSFGYLNEDGILVTDKDNYTRYNVSSFVNTEVTPWLSFLADVKYANSRTDEPNMTSLRAWNPYRLAQLLPSYYPEGNVELGGETLPIGTPRWNIENSPLKTQKQEDIRLFGKAIFKPLEGLVINAEYTFNRTNTSKEEYNKKMAYVNAEKAFQKQYTHSGNTSYRLDEIHVNYNAINIYGNYEKTWGDHNASVMGGFNQEYS